MKIKRIQRKTRGAPKIKVPRLPGLRKFKERIAEIKKRKAGLYWRFKKADSYR